MADNAAEKKEDGTAAAPAPTAEKIIQAPPQKPILFIIVVALNMLVMVSVAGILWTAYKAEKAKPTLQDVVKGEKEDSAKRDDSTDTKEMVGKLIPMETFLVNLAGSRGNKLVKINMELELDGDKVEEEIEKRKPQLRDIIIILLSSKTYDMVVPREGKERLRSEVRDTINPFLTKGKIKNVYFTDFIVN